MKQPLQTDKVIFSEINGKYKVAVATLNSPATLNSLTQEMIDALTERLIAWNKDPKIAAIFLEGAGDKAFCAGGDIKNLYASIIKDRIEANQFFRTEYSLDYAIHTSPKPVIIWGHGIVMGGGLGLMNGGAARIVTENTKVAMPEITIGLFPDVGATYFLNRMPPGCGLFSALTGVRLNAGDSLFLGLADYFIPLKEKDNFKNFLSDIPFTDTPKKNRELLKSAVKAFVAPFRNDCPSSEIQAHFSDIKRLAECYSLEAFERALREISADPYMQKALASFEQGSPTSAHVIFLQIKNHRKLKLVEALNFELGLSMQFAKNHDLREGIRALLIEKDMKPQWKPSKRELVGAEIIQAHFEKLPEKITEHFA